MTIGFKTKGNIRYGIKDSEAMIEEIYNLLKEDIMISETIPDQNFNFQKDTDTNMQDIEKEIDNYIDKEMGLKKQIVDIFAKRNIIIPHQRAVDKNEVIDAKKRIIKNAIGMH